jgi:hypothetical protein
MNIFILLMRFICTLSICHKIITNLIFHITTHMTLFAQNTYQCSLRSNIRLRIKSAQTRFRSVVVSGDNVEAKT